uniref:AlNc14C4G641 protein n=1 Tax=Albugo laibachii Nc14 TaxID=890382 RepID=F0W0J9_9STRA|nr:AlNc14C4G641 [Albugo laibachii Nc14]|eukprot:CCA14571.1 AlNc14C4G641 [Albugo laibachii Nc14]
MFTCGPKYRILPAKRAREGNAEKKRAEIPQAFSCESCIKKFAASSILRDLRLTSLKSGFLYFDKDVDTIYVTAKCDHCIGVYTIPNNFCEELEPSSPSSLLLSTVGKSASVSNAITNPRPSTDDTTADNSHPTLKLVFATESRIDLFKRATLHIAMQTDVYLVVLTSSMYILFRKLPYASIDEICAEISGEYTIENIQTSSPLTPLSLEEISAIVGTSVRYPDFSLKKLLSEQPDPASTSHASHDRFSNS